jgi:PTS system fructose-specific IIC component/PTS system nitrogen regulatory IIA component
MRLSERFTEKCIIIDSQKPNKREIIEEMVNLLCQAYQIENRDGIMRAVFGREEKMSTGIGCGLAVPHGKVDFLDKMCVVACSVKRGIDFEAIDKESVYLLFLIVSPSNTTGPHIRALSAISRIMADADIRKSLIASNSSEEFYANLKLGEEKYS